MADKHKPDKLEHPEPQVSDELAAATRLDSNSHTRPNGSALDPVNVTAAVFLREDDPELTADAALWAAIRNRTDAIQGDRYEEFIKQVLCLDYGTKGASCLPEKLTGSQIGTSLKAKRAELIGATSGYGVDAYNLLKYATQAFLLLEAGVVIKLPRFPLNEAEKHLTINDIVPDEIRTFLATLVPLPYLQRVVAALESGFDENISPFCKG